MSSVKKFRRSRAFLVFEETMHVLSVGIKVLLEQAFTAVGYRFVEVGLYCCLKRRYRFYLLAFKFSESRPLLLFKEQASTSGRGYLCFFSTNTTTILGTVQFSIWCHLALSNGLHST